MNNNQLMLVLEKLELYLVAGLPIDKAIRIVSRDASKRHLKNFVLLEQDVLSGKPISTSFRERFHIPNTICSLIEHGESSGSLPASLLFARQMLERQAETVKKCLSALIYPVVIGLFSVILTIGLVRGVMPQITPMLRGLHIDLPLLTRLTIVVSDFLVAYGVYAGIGVITLVVILITAYKKVDKLKQIIQTVVLHVPVIGPMYFSYSLTLFLRSCGSLIGSGVPVQKAFSQTATSLSLLPFRQSLLAKISDINRGASFGQVLSTLPIRIPLYIPSLIMAGEASGGLSQSLLRASIILDREMDHSLKRLTSLIEPSMMVGMGLTVGSIALSIMMPIYDISKTLQR